MRPAAGVVLRWGALLALAGGLLGVVGVFLPWATLTSVGTLVAPVETTLGVAGIRSWLGLAGLVASGIAVLGAIGAGFFEDPPGRRSAALVAAAAGAMVIVAALLGLAQQESVATTGLPGGTEALEFAREFAAEFNRELDLDIPAPTVEPGTGVFLTAVGGGLAAAGGLLSVWQEGRRRRGLHFGR